MNSYLTRRHFLRSSSACIALPFLASLGFRRFASAAPIAARPKRMIFLAMGWGVTNETWYPNPKQTGAEWTLPEGLKPLAKFQKDITLVQNTYHKHSIDGHSGSTFWLTGANQYGMPGRSFHNTISVDQVAAAVRSRDEVCLAELRQSGRRRRSRWCALVESPGQTGLGVVRPGGGVSQALLG